MKRLFPFLGLLIACVACASTAPLPPDSAIEPTEALYTPGAVVTVALRNFGETDLSYSDCGASLERLDAGKWVSVPVDGPNCADALRVVGAGQTISFPVSPKLPSTLANGVYRYVLSFLGTPVDGNRGASDRTTSPFRVTNNVFSG
jgi:hypothetical protein